VTSVFKIRKKLRILRNF